MSWRINKIEIENFKFFRHVFTIDVSRNNILLYGENGSGKSSIYWSVYTHFQAYAKSRAEAQKYFVAEHAQNLRNRYAAADDDSVIRIHFDNASGMTKVVEDSNKCYYAEDEEVLKFMKFTAMSSDFMNYKFLSSLFDFRNSQENEVFPLIEKEVLPYVDFLKPLWHIDRREVNTNNAGEWWGYLKSVLRSGGLPRSVKGNSFDQRTPQYKLYNSLLKEFNDALESKLAILILRANKIIKEVFGLDVRIILQYEDATFNNRLASRRFDGKLHSPSICLKAQMVSEHLVDTSLIEHPRSFFNEAKITCMALALRLAILEDHSSSEEAPSVLFVDDLLISLDMPFRRKVIEVLLSYTKKFQMFILTHDRAFYHLVWSEIKINGLQDWMKYELYACQENGVPEPVLFVPKTPLECAKMHLRNLEIHASVNGSRRAAEQELKRLLPTNLTYTIKSNVTLCDLYTLTENFCKFAKKIGLPNLIPHLQDHRQLLLNPFSHDDVDTPFYRRELEQTIHELECLSRIERRVLIGAKDTYQRGYFFVVEKDGAKYEYEIVFKELLYEYEYEGNLYYTSPKIDVKSSDGSEKGDRNYSLRQFYEMTCGRVFRGTTGWPVLKDCLRHNEKGMAS